MQIMLQEHDSARRLAQRQSPGDDARQAPKSPTVGVQNANPGRLACSRTPWPSTDGGRRLRKGDKMATRQLRSDAVQAEPAFLDLEGAVEKTIGLIDQAGARARS